MKTFLYCLFIYSCTIIVYDDVYAQSDFTYRAIAGLDSELQSAQGADIDNDGIGDVVVASTERNIIIWYKHDGNYNFTPYPIEADFSGGANSLSLIDIDKDSDIDIISGSLFDGRLRLFTNDGSGTFTQSVLYDEKFGISEIAAADINEDGHIDIVAALKFANQVVLYENDGSLNFTASIVTSAAIVVEDVKIHDVDKDGDLDLISASSLDNKIAWYENRNASGFVNHTISIQEGNAVAVFPIDLDMDGDEDILSLARDRNQLAWHINEGQNTFRRRSISATSPGATRHFDLVAGDFDMDGDYDIFTNYRYYRNMGSATFTGSHNGTITTGESSVSLAQLDNTPNPELLVATGGYTITPGLEAIKVSGGSLSSTLINPIFQAPSSITSADLDGNNEPDLLISDRRADSRLILVQNLGNGDRLFKKISFQTVPNFTMTSIKTRVNDINNDGASDIVLFGEVSGYDKGRMILFENNGILSYTQTVLSTHRVKDGSIVDLDQDGDTDIVAAFTRRDSIMWFSNIGSSSFSQILITDDAPGVSALQTVDIEQDGDIDIITANISEDAIVVYENDGAQGFTKRSVAISTDVNLLSMGDLNQDTYPDFVYASNSDVSIRALLNDQNGDFLNTLISDNIPDISSINITDLDNDGDKDLVISSESERTIYWFENNSMGNFNRYLVGSPATITGTSTGDFNSDGAIDIFAISDNSNSLFWYENGLITNSISPSSAPITAELMQNYPNPFNPETTIRFELFETQTAELKIYNSIGQIIKDYDFTNYVPGQYSVIWSGRDESGNRVASGVYYYELEMDNASVTKRMLLVR